MKKGLFLMGVMAFMVIVAPNAYAATTITQADFNAAKGGTPTNGITYDDVNLTYNLDENGEFTFGSDIDLSDASLVINKNTINTNGKTITSSSMSTISALNTTLTLSGNGTVTSTGGSSIVSTTSTLNISAGTYTSGVVVNGGKANISGGTFNSSAWGGAAEFNNADITITNGTFNANGASAVYIADGNINISGGSFTSAGDNGIEFMSVGTLKISGGTFTGASSGINLPGTENVTLSGGTYKATSNTGFGGIVVFGQTDPTLLNNLVAANYKYSPNLEATHQDWYGMNIIKSQNEISVVSTNSVPATAVDNSTTSTDNTATATSVEKTSNNPKTGDNILLFIVLSVISIIGLSTNVVLKKRFN